MGGGAPAGPTPPFIGWAIAGLVQAILCGNILFGGLGALFAFLGKSEWDKGQTDTALGKLKASKILTIIGFCLVGIGIVLYVILMVVGIAGGAASSY